MLWVLCVNLSCDAVCCGPLPWSRALHSYPLQETITPRPSSLRACSRYANAMTCLSLWMKCKLGAEPRERCGKELRREEGKRVLGWGRGEGKRVSVGERGG